MVWARGSIAAFPRFWATRCSATHPVMPSPIATRSWSVVSSMYSPTCPTIATGEQLVAGDPVDADVVIVDQLPELGRDREPDLIDLAQPVEPRTQLLDRLELGRPRRHPVVVLRGADRHAGLRCELCHGLELVLRPLVGPVVVDVQHAEELPAIEQRSDADRVEALPDDVCPDVGSARIVAIADGEEWPAGGDRTACQ